MLAHNFSKLISIEVLDEPSAVGNSLQENLENYYPPKFSLVKCPYAWSTDRSSNRFI